MIILTKKRQHLAVLVPDGRTDHGVEPKRHNGALVRVMPQTARDVFGLQMLEHHREKFAPKEGAGILVTPDALEKIYPRRKA